MDVKYLHEKQICHNYQTSCPLLTCLVYTVLLHQTVFASKQLMQLAMQIKLFFEHWGSNNACDSSATPASTK